MSWLRKILRLTFALFALLLLGQFTCFQFNTLNARSSPQLPPLKDCNISQKIIENDQQAIEFAKEFAFEPTYAGTSSQWDTVFSSNFYKHPSNLGKSIKGMMWHIGREKSNKFSVDFRFDDGEINAAIFAVFTHCGVLIDRGHVLTKSPYPQYKEKN